MNVHLRVPLFFLALGVGMGAVACGSGSTSLTGPSAPSAATGPAATIQGTVLSSVAGASTGPGSVHALSTGVGIRVSVSGTALVTMTDSSGKFVLTGVPSGQVELHFQGPGIDARLDISGLNPGQTLTITVNVNGGQATLKPDSDDKGEVDLSGAIQSIDTGTGSFMVGGRKVVTNASTKIVGGEGATISLSALAVGAKVQVHGTAQADMSVLAQTVKLDQDEDNQKQVDLQGAIQSLDMGTGSLMVAGRKVVTNSATKILGRDGAPVSLSTLTVGTKIQVHGTTQADGSVLAQTIRLQDDQDDNDVEFSGKIQSINTGTGTLMVAGKTIATDMNTRIQGGEDSHLTLADLKVGEAVEVSGAKRPDGSVLARQISVEGDD